MLLAAMLPVANHFQSAMTRNVDELLERLMRSGVRSAPGGGGFATGETPASHLRKRPPERENDSAMTVLSTASRRRPVSHAFTTPVVRELAPQTVQVAAGTAW
jgi:hypothetical protein